MVSSTGDLTLGLLGVGTCSASTRGGRPRRFGVESTGDFNFVDTASSLFSSGGDKGKIGAIITNDGLRFLENNDTTSDPSALLGFSSSSGVDSFRGSTSRI